jgi:2-dehydropantoate 2-reductase
MTDLSGQLDRPVVVYGAGAIGGVLAARLRLAGVDVSAVARGAHLAAIRDHGLRLVTQIGEDTVALPAVERAGDIDWSGAPIVVLAVKSHQTAVALDDLAAHAPADTAVFSAQNGVANEYAVLRRFAGVYGVMVAMPATHLEPGVVIQQSHPVAGLLDVGRYPRGHDELSHQLASTLRAAQFSSEVRDDVMAWKHRKLLANIGNGVTAAFRPGPDADELVLRARREAQQVLTDAGIAVVSADEEQQRRGDLLRGKVRADYFGSTWQSVQRGHTDVETDWLNGEIVLQARLRGQCAPINEFLQRITAEHARSGREPRSLDAAEALAKFERES